MSLLELVAILGMALATWLTRTLPLLTRSSGETLVEGFAQRFVKNLPPAILAALIGPKVIEGDASIWISALLTLALVGRFGNVLLGVVAGTASCALLRWAMGVLA
jgi:branched-subunit amino acid transport protein